MKELQKQAQQLAIDAERISELLAESGTPLWDIAHSIGVIMWRYGEIHQEVKKMEKK